MGIKDLEKKYELHEIIKGDQYFVQPVLRMEI